MSKKLAVSLDDNERLSALNRTKLLDSLPESSFDRLTTLASKIVNAPVSLVSLVEPHRQYFKSQIGLAEPYITLPETTLDYSFCQYVVTSGEELIIEDARKHPLVCDNLAITELDVIAYLGIPITTKDGWHLGSFCVIDNEPRVWNEDEIDTMRTLAASVTNEIQLRLDALEKENLVEQLRTRNHDLDAFSRTVSHNLKNSISGIMGWADVSMQYADRISTEELLETMDKIHLLAHGTNSTINALMMLSGIERIESVEMQPLRMFDILEDALTRLERQMIDAQARIHLPDEFPNCLGYREWVIEIWLNYISNALKYGGNPPKLEFGADVLPDNMVRYWIKDNGEGISEDDQQRLFQSFSRLAQHDNIEGHGLGLSIVKRIVTKLGGEVDVESSVGEGTTFSFTLPTR